MRHQILHLMCVVVLMNAAYAQQSHWATPDDKTARFMIAMERKWELAHPFTQLNSRGWPVLVAFSATGRGF